MTTRCTACGHELSHHGAHHESESDTNWLGEPSSDDGRSGTITRPTRPKRTGRDRKLLLAVVGALAAWGIFVSVSGVVSPDDTIDEQAAADIEEARIEQETRATAEAEAEAERQRPPDPTPAPVEDTSDQESRTVERAVETWPEVSADWPAVDFASLGFESRFPAQVGRMAREFRRRDRNAVVAYRSNDGIVLFNVANGAVGIAPTTEAWTTRDPGLELLRAGDATFAIDPASFITAQVVDDGGLLVSTASDGNTYFVDTKTRNALTPIIEIVATGESTFLGAPTGRTLLPVDGLGLIAVSEDPSEPTLLADTESFIALSEHRVVAANGTAILEEICLDDAPCALIATDLTSLEQWQVPASFVRDGDEYLLSPNGKSLLRFTEAGFGEIYSAESDVISGVIGPGMTDPVWGPDSDFVAWMDRVGPAIKVRFVDESRTLSVETAVLNAPRPLGPEILALADTSTAGEAG